MAPIAPRQAEPSSGCWRRGIGHPCGAIRLRRRDLGRLALISARKAGGGAGFPLRSAIGYSNRVPPHGRPRLQNSIARVPFEARTGLKAFVVANALTDIGAPKEIISPLVQHLPKLWELVHHYGMTTLELNPIRMRPAGRAISMRRAASRPSPMARPSASPFRSGLTWALHGSRERRSPPLET